MADIRQHVVFIGVVGAVGGAMVAWGPESPLAVGAVFLGFVVLHGTSLTVRGPAQREEPAPRRAPAGGGRASATAASTGGSTGSTGVAGPAGEAPPRRREPPESLEAPRGSEEGRPGPRPRGNGREPDDADGSERTPEESIWVRQQLTEDVDDIAFLPPYASGEAAAGDESSSPGGRTDWREFLVDDPGEGFEGKSRTTETSRNVPIPRHFALGTVAIIRGVLSPEEVARVLLEQRRQPRKQFGEVAVEMGVLRDAQLRDLLIAQQEGLFTDEEIREARRKLREFRDREREQ